MGQEIERKFLVKNDSYKNHAEEMVEIRQGYLSSVPERNVRIRINGNKGIITVKGLGNETGVTRFEWEKEISVEEAKALLDICEPGKIEKKRYIVKYGEHVYEVDEFLNENLGLVIAELELSSEDESFEKPDWVDKEVTGEVKYYNSELLRNPYKNWKSI
ncbi:CYTH domain-containing protein [Namhaeicola litoreus]|uniref:CYTH domain-containing protein n=1 Tax=Namhaeicola litoreus TaxID=1052145 RepID=A0ABW3Y1D7_9FLAO